MQLAVFWQLKTIAKCRNLQIVFLKRIFDFLNAIDNERLKEGAKFLNFKNDNYLKSHFFRLKTIFRNVIEICSTQFHVIA